MTEIKELREYFRTQQSKLVYYVIALSVACIGFSVYQTTGIPLQWSHIILGSALTCWAISIFCGMTFLKYLTSTTYANVEYLKVKQGNHPEYKHPDKAQAALDGISSAMKSNVKTGGYYSKWQGRLFYAGAALFIAWHITEMYLMRISG